MEVLGDVSECSLYMECETLSNYFKLSGEVFEIFLFYCNLCVVYMEYEESVAGLNSVPFEDENSLNLLLCRELIELVKSNELLWKKRCISYKDQQMKNVYWQSVGDALTSPLSGTDAEKEFYKLRQKFGREVRKEKENTHRSGAWAGQQTYISNWILYKDLEFLKDVIKPRQTISNFSNKSLIVRSSLSPPLGDNPSPSCSRDSDIDSSLLSESDADNSSSMRQLPSPIATLKRTVPAPDLSYVKKKKAQDDMAIAIEKHSSNLNMLTNKITQYLENPTSATTQQQENSLILSALAEVPKENLLSCIIEVLQIVQKYIKKK